MLPNEVTTGRPSRTVIEAGVSRAVGSWFCSQPHPGTHIIGAIGDFGEVKDLIAGVEEDSADLALMGGIPRHAEQRRGLDVGDRDRDGLLRARNPYLGRSSSTVFTLPAESPWRQPKDPGVEIDRDDAIGFAVAGVDPTQVPIG
jgi:hypothetical protein